MPETGVETVEESGFPRQVAVDPGHPRRLTRTYNSAVSERDE